MGSPEDSSSDERPLSHPPGEARTRAESDAATFAGGTDPSEGVGLHRLLVDSVEDYAIFALDPQGYILSWNAGARRLKGYEAEEIIGRHFSVFYPADDLAAGKPARELEVATRVGKYEEEGWRLRKDGSRFWANVVITALRRASGTLVGFAKVTRDLTDRRRAEERLRESEERFRLLVQGVKDYAIFMLDPGGHILSWNQGAERLKGYTEEEILGQHFSIFYPPGDLAAGKPAWELEVATREGKYEEEGWRLRKDGSRFWANVLITAIRNAAGTLVGFAKVTRDLTERRATQEQLIADARRLAEAEAESRTKSEFLRVLSHELRTPINATIGYNELLELGIAGPVTERQVEYLHRIRKTQEHLLRLINDLLNYSRIEAGKMEYDLVPVPVAEMVEDAVAMLEAQASRKGITLVGRSGSTHLTARTDRVRAEQILLNVLSNAVKFTPTGGRVTAEAEADEDRVLVRVADTGPGIPPERQEAIFEPFVQVGRSLTSDHEGTGLGLSISRDLARAMGGDLTVTSVEGQGATFTIALPRV